MGYLFIHYCQVAGYPAACKPHGIYRNGQITSTDPFVHSHFPVSPHLLKLTPMGSRRTATEQPGSGPTSRSTGAVQGYADVDGPAAGSRPAWHFPSQQLRFLCGDAMTGLQ